MKKIYELGISNYPWNREFGECGTVFDSTYCIVATIDADSKKEKEANTNFIRAAPEMYEALSELVEEIECGQDCNSCKNKECRIIKAKAALAMASGDEVSHV